MDSESVLAIVFGAALAVFSLGVVGYSFAKGRENFGFTLESDPQILRAESTHGNGPSIDAIYESIYTLELEYELGNLPEQQFQEQFQSYRMQAAVALKEQLDIGNADPLWLLEQQVIAARSEMRGNQLLASVCQDCSGPIAIGAAACSNCGAKSAPQHTPIPKTDDRK